MRSLVQIIQSTLTRRLHRQALPEGDVRAVFKKFQKVLEDNGQALAVIADLGEKMSGDYLFDETFIRRAYGDLSTGVKRSMADFRKLTAGRYPALEGVFNQIDGQIASLIDGTYRPIEKLALPFNEIRPDIAREVGGKNFHLAELKNRLGLPIPQGFVLTVNAYEQYIKFNLLDDVIASLKKGEPQLQDLQQIRKKILSGEMPPALRQALNAELEKLKKSCGKECFLAVRSSAEEEDDVFSFAGQFETVLNVPAAVDAVEDAYRRVIASLFSPQAIAYQRSLRYTPGSLRMAVGILQMVDVQAAGVIFTSDPSGEKKDVMLLNSNMGLGTTVVEGSAEADYFMLDKKPPFPEIETRIANKAVIDVAAPGRGVAAKKLSSDLSLSRSLTASATRDIAEKAAAIEKFFGGPQDIEWALDQRGRVILLQSRPLKIRSGRTLSVSGNQVKTAQPALSLTKGYVVQRGAVSGRVFLVSSPDDLDNFPQGGILVARNDSPQFAAVMPYAAAIITDTGNPASHMASISRDLRVPTVVNTEIATKTLKAGEEITLVADDDGQVTVYEGVVRDAIDEQHRSFIKLKELYEFRRQRYIMQFIAPLNLINPFEEQFKPENCKTLHDILRFIHEMAIHELLEAAKKARGAESLRRLQLPIPLLIQVIDLGDGLVGPGSDVATLDQVVSLPLKSILKGMTHPDVWQKEAGQVSFSDFLAGMVRTGDLANATSGPTLTVAVISHNYMNLSLRLGYHFNLVDCYLSDRAASNHIYFRFFGGGAGITKRKRRVNLIETVLNRLGFVSRINGDLIEGRISNISQEEAEGILDQLGRLIGFTRQLDTALGSDGVVEKLADRFMDEHYVA